tara:strand:+ start:3651 stop:5135 length:1485 start_codon:yes stop_codon:yes gene_type:complete
MLKLINERFPDVEKFLKHHHLEIDNLQSYYPCNATTMDTIRKNKWTTIELGQRIIKVVNKCHDFHRGLIKDISGNIQERGFYIKCTPILEPLSICSGYYQSSVHHPWLPCSDYQATHLYNKIEGGRNSAFLETTCSIILNNLRILGLTNHFGYIYGLYSGIKSDYKEDITDDYEILRDEGWFKRAILRKHKLEIKKRDIKNVRHVISDISDITECNLDDYAVDMSGEIEFKVEESDEIEEVSLIHPKIPIQIVLMEKCDETFDDLIKSRINRLRIPTRFDKLYEIRKKIVLERLRSWLFQICAGLSVANKEVSFVHNDLHIQNVMGRRTEDEYQYYKRGEELFKVPTYGYIMQMIDYGRSTYKIDNELQYGDIFEIENEAGGQYTLPEDIRPGKKIVQPNSAFDLARFACSFVEDLDNRLWPTQNDLDDSDIGTLLNSWTYDDRDDSLLDIDGFQLYVHIAKCFRKKKPYKQFDDEAFLRYKTNDNHDGKIYNL